MAIWRLRRWWKHCLKAKRWKSTHALRKILTMVEAEALVYTLPDGRVEVGVQRMRNTTQNVAEVLVNTQAERVKEKKVDTLADKLAAVKAEALVHTLGHRVTQVEVDTLVATLSKANA